VLFRSVDQHGNEAVIAVSDDGRGFNLDGLRDYGPDAASDDEVIGLAFQPGVTTAQAVTDISGRGVGLDVVREQIETIHGRIGVVNRPGQGVTIELTVPTSLAMTQGLMVRVGQSVYALPLLAVEKILWPEEVFAVNDRWMLPVDNTSIPLVSLADLLDEPETNSDRRQQAVIVAIAQYRVALLVDRVLAQQELAVKPLGDPLVHIPMVQGAALLGDGKPVIVLNPADLVKGETRTARLRVTEAVEDLSGTHILVVDDSITTRTLEQNILEMAGYQVMTAVNGQEALDKLAETAFDCIISDIEMPLVDGFELTRRIRADARFSDLPVILVTSLAKADDRERGLHAGADAYIVKRGFDQGELLRIIKDLLV
jgi:two-component system, chemotaxis family, sensor kinase CheA